MLIDNENKEEEKTFDDEVKINPKVSQNQVGPQLQQEKIQLPTESNPAIYLG